MNLTLNYSEVKKYRGFSLRNILRDVALDCLSVKNGFSNTEQWLKRPRVQFLFIHHIFNDEQEKLDRLLKTLSKDHEFISQTEAVNRLISGKIDKPYISWSSDDGFKNNMRAAEVFNNYGIKACFYINPETIGLKDSNKILEFCDVKLKMPPIEFANWQDVELLLKQGHEIGSHTLAHDNVATMSKNQMEEDLIQSKFILEKYCGSIKHFAYPYGHYSDFNKIAFDTVFSVGYDSCATATRGCHVSDGNKISKEKLCLRRDQVICAWKLQHILHFVLNASKNASLENNFIPKYWQI